MKGPVLGGGGVRCDWGRPSECVDFKTVQVLDEMWAHARYIGVGE